MNRFGWLEILIFVAIGGLPVFWIVWLIRLLSKVCSSCHKRSFNGGTFCPKCGNSFSGDIAQPDSETLADDTAAPPEDPPPAEAD